MTCRRKYPGGEEGLVVPGGGQQFGSCPCEATRFFVVERGSSLYATCDFHAPDVVIAVKKPWYEVSSEEAEVFLVIGT